MSIYKSMIEIVAKLSKVCTSAYLQSTTKPFVNNWEMGWDLPKLGHDNHVGNGDLGGIG